MPQLGHWTGPTRSSSVFDMPSTMLASSSPIENFGDLGMLSRPFSSAHAWHRCSSVIRLSWISVRCRVAGFFWQFWHGFGISVSLREDPIGPGTPAGTGPSGGFPTPVGPSCVQN
jgi:hypothetical protein